PAQPFVGVHERVVVVEERAQHGGPAGERAAHVRHEARLLGDGAHPGPQVLAHVLQLDVAEPAHGGGVRHTPTLTPASFPLIAPDDGPPNRDDADMAVPEEIRTRLSHWCDARVPAEERDTRQVAYTIHGDAITILERRPPAYPELGAAWSATPVARLV